MNDVIYTFKGRNITMNVCIQIRAVVKVIMNRKDVTFEEAMMMFYHSQTYKILKDTENGLWAESAEYIADQFFEEKEYA